MTGNECLQSLRRLAILLIGPLAMAPAWADCSPDIRLIRPDSRYEAVAGAIPSGSEVRDKVTGLIWQRCVLGTVWDGRTCTGEDLNYTFTMALEAARTVQGSAAPGASAWRVPNVKELATLVEIACRHPAINSTWFLADPGMKVWSASPFVEESPLALVVDFSDGRYVVTSSSIGAHRVRLVR